MENKEIEFIELDDTKKEMLLKILDFDIDESGLLINKKTGQAHVCPMTGENVHLHDASILPWTSVIVIKTTPLSLAKYFDEYKKMKANKNDR